MLTPDKVAEAVRFVIEALSAPDRVIERTGMGNLHAALAPALETWVEECGGTRDILLVSASGSVNYNLTTEDSDLDLKAAYLPTLEDFYHNRFPKFNLVTPEFDCEVQAVHKFVHDTMKGHINAFEPLYAKSSLADPDFAHIMNLGLKPLVEMNVMSTVRACYFSAVQTDAEAVANGWKPRKAAHALRFLLFLITLLDRGQFDYVLHEPLKTAILNVKIGKTSRGEYVPLFDELLDTAKTMAFRYVNSGNDYVFTDRVIELDERSSPEWEKLRAWVDAEMIDLVRQPIESSFRDAYIAAE